MPLPTGSIPRRSGMIAAIEAVLRSQSEVTAGSHQPQSCQMLTIVLNTPTMKYQNAAPKIVVMIFLLFAYANLARKPSHGLPIARQLAVLHRNAVDAEPTCPASLRATTKDSVSQSPPSGSPAFPVDAQTPLLRKRNPAEKRQVRCDRHYPSLGERWAGQVTSAPQLPNIDDRVEQRGQNEPNEQPECSHYLSPFV